MKPIAVAALFLLTGCAAGPDYVRPNLPPAARFTPQALPETTASAQVAGGAAQRFVAAHAIDASWWQRYQSPALNQLVAEAMAASPTLAAARAALRGAQENVAAQQGVFMPTVQAGYAPSRTKIAGNLGGNSPGVQGDGSVISTGAGTPAAQGGTGPYNQPVTYTFHTAQLTVGYVPDVFGANRRQVEAADAEARYAALQLQAARTTLAANLVGAAIQEALLREQIAITRTIIDASTQSVAVLRRQQHAGFASNLDIRLQEGALIQAQQQLLPLTRQLDQTRNLLRALSGKAPDQDLVQVFDAGSLRLPLDVPSLLPSQVVELRPDVRAAEEQVRVASAQAGVAAAARLPQFSIDGAIGGAASHFDQMFWPSGAFFNIVGNIAQPLFDGGALKHRQRAAEAALQQSAAQYQATVITAFQNVADTLRALHADADALQAAVAVEQNAGASLALVRRQLAGGYIDRLALIAAEQAARQGAVNVAQAKAARLADTAALFQALGGGWDPQSGSAR
jgi:NodT family efflux transporter outer membrane factor (OMF) lipoprotein